VLDEGAQVVDAGLEATARDVQEGAHAQHEVAGDAEDDGRVDVAERPLGSL
jgi:hypothetical protein